MPSASFPPTRTATTNAASTPGETSLLAAFKKYDPADPTTGDDCAAALHSVMSVWEQAHRRLWPVWTECWGMTTSDQYGNYSAETRTWAPRDPAPEKKLTRVELNHMMPLLTDVANLQCQDPVNLRATTGTDSTAAASAQLTADQLLDYLWEQGGYDDKNFELRFAAGVGGNWFLYPLWDASAGRLVEVIDHYEPVPGPPDPITGAPTGMGLKPVMKKVREGNFADRTAPCFAGLPDPAAAAEWDGEGFAMHERLPLATLRQLYPQFAEDLVVDRSSGGSDGTFYSERLKGVSPRTGGMMGSASQEQASESTSVYTIFLRTCDDFYRGRWAVIACGKLLVIRDNPVYPTQVEEDRGEEFPQYHWPVWRIAHDLVPGSYFAQGGAVRILGAQRKLNGAASKGLHIAKRSAHPVLVKPKRADFIKSDEPDQQINVSDTLPPNSIYYLQWPGVPPELRQMEKDSVEQMQDILGVHSSTRGESQAGNSGTKDRQLTQRDLGRLVVIKNRTDRQLAQAFSYKLRLWRRYATTARTIRIVGENNATAVKSFDMSTIAAGTDVVVYQDSQLPKDPAARMLHVKEAVQMGIIDVHDPVQRAAVAEAVGLGTYRHFEATLYADRKAAETENVNIYDGEAPAVEFWHDDMQHLAAHFAEMNTERWKTATTPLPNDPPQIVMRKQSLRQSYIQHCQAHQQQMAKKSGGQGGNAPPPSESIGFKDLPPSGQVQMAAKVGIKLDPAELQAQQQLGAAPGGPGPGPMGARPNQAATGPAGGGAGKPALDLSAAPPIPKSAPGGPPAQMAA